MEVMTAAAVTANKARRKHKEKVQEKVANGERRPHRNLKIAAGLGFAGLALVGASRLTGIGLNLNLPNFGGVGVKDKESTQVTEDVVTEIDSEDLHCVVKVTSRGQVDAKIEHDAQLFIFGERTIGTDVYKLDATGDTELCVDNGTFKPKLTEHPDGSKELDVFVPGFTSNRPRVLQDDSYQLQKGDSLWKKGSGILSDGGKEPVVKGLGIAMQRIVEKNGCVDPALKLARENVVAHYKSLGAIFGVSDVQVSFGSVAPSGETVSSGSIDNFLHEDPGFEFPGIYTFNGQECSATLIDGEPVVAEKPNS